MSPVAKVKEELRGGPRTRCLFAGDAGMVSQANLQKLSKGGGKYLLATDVCSRKRNADGRLIGQRSLNWNGSTASL
jgi:hypothetical protein